MLLPSLLTQEHEARSFFDTLQTTVEIQPLCILMQCYYLLLQASLSLCGDFQKFGAKFPLACKLLIRHCRLIVLYLAQIELIFLLVSDTVLCFGFGIRITLIAH